MSILTGTSLVGGSVNYERVENDFYATDPSSVEALLEVLELKSKSFYEPCCGQGHISKVLGRHFSEANHYATDLVYRGYGTGGVDFINTPSIFLPKAEWIITNPPYSIAKEFIDKSLSIATKGVAMFLKIQFLEGQARKEWFANTPLKAVYVFSKRQDPWRDGEQLNPKTGKKWGSTMCFAWFVWEHGYLGNPTIKWI